MDGPDQGSAADHGLMRASRDDRERVIDVIKTAFVQDRLDLDELSGRVGQALAARTWGQLAALTADLPGLAGAAPRAVPGPRTAGQIMARACGWTVVSVLAMIVLVRSGLLLLAFFALPVPVGILGYGILEVTEAARPGGTLARSPGRHRRAADRPADLVRAVHGTDALVAGGVGVRHPR